MESFLSKDTLANWLKLILITNFFNSQVLLSVLSYAWEGLTRRFYTSVEFDEFDTTYCWVNIWLAQQPEWYTARDLSITTRTFGLDTGDSCGAFDEDVYRPRDLKVRKQPSLFVTTSFWFKGHYLRVTRTKTQGTYDGLQKIKIRIYGHNPRIVDDLLADAERCWKEARAEHITIYSTSVMNKWHQAAARPKRPLGSIILDHGVKEDLLSDARSFLASRPWYSERGIPFRRGYLLYGVPGSGKTSLIQSLAGELGLDIYMISLSGPGLDDAALQDLFSRLPERCIALMEDIDAAFRHDINRDVSHTDSQRARFPSAGSATQSGGVTLSGLLNVLDGAAAHEGRLLFATTNDCDSLDSALRRPGRMDRLIEFKLASRCQIAEMFQRFYGFTTSVPLPPVRASEEDEKNNDEDWSPNSVSLSLVDLGSEVQTPGAVSSKSSDDEHELKEWQAAKLEDQAQKFASLVPDRFISMAELQGYLVHHKTDPVSALAGVRKFIREIRDEKGRSEVESKLLCTK